MHLPKKSMQNTNKNVFVILPTIEYVLSVKWMKIRNPFYQQVCHFTKIFLVLLTILL